MQLGDPIGFVNVKGERLPIYPSEEFLRMLESMFVNEGVTETELGAAEQTLEQTTQLAGQVQQAAQTAQQSADSAAEAAATVLAEAQRLDQVKLEDAALGPLRDRLTALEQQ